MILRKLFWQLYLSFLLILGTILCAVILYSTIYVRKDYEDLAINQLTTQVNILRPRITRLLNENDYKTLHQTCRDIYNYTNIQMTVILPDGRVVADSIADPWQIQEYILDIETLEEGARAFRTQDLKQAFDGRELSLFIPLPGKGMDTMAYVRISEPTEYIDRRLGALYVGFLQYGLFLSLVAALACFLITRRITRPIYGMTRSAEQLARGDLSVRLNHSGTDEFDLLSEAVNKMAIQLDERIRSLVQNRNELQAVLSSMAEGVIAINGDGRIVSVNHSACDLLGVSRDRVVNRTIEEAVRDAQLQDFIKSALIASGPMQREVVVPDQQVRFIHAYGRVLDQEEGGEVRAIIVLNNITQVRRLENVRREFVANVSHELKTPITSIKGFVETLLDGAIEKPEEAKRFLRIIARHTNRLNAIIEDILILSRIEDESGKAAIPMEKVLISDPITGAVETCFMKAREKDIELTVDCPQIEAELNSFMIEQALVNIIDNAIKYSNPGSRIEITGELSNSNVRISVSDSGYGISPEHLDRIFERFYVTDKARSRKLGGTGLGLAIVKHIINAHGGIVEVESEPGVGSTFIMAFPAVRETEEKESETIDTFPGETA